MKQPADVRVRFAPSPTGTLHLGSARSALYNWLFARHHGAHGTYVLRIEDTDVERSTPAHVEQALRVFGWLGLDWDEGPGVEGTVGPYHQSERSTHYVAALAELLERGRAYHCFCTAEQLAADRAAAEEAGRPSVYVGRCRGRDDAAERLASGEPAVVRFAVPVDGHSVVHDIVLGDTTFENALLGDFVIARADGSPLYNFANVVDDVAMRITHVIRGNDHLSNTPRQVLLYEALESPVPRFAHLPMVLGPDGAKLSKRRHHTSTVEELAREGYIPSAVRNGLALVGWSRDDVTNVMTTEELVASFSLERVRRAPAAIDYDKLRWLNGEHLRALDPGAWADEYEAWRAGWLVAGDPRFAAANVVDGRTAAMLVQEKVTAFGDAADMLAFLVDPWTIAPEAHARLEKDVEQNMRVLSHLEERLASLPDFELATLEVALRESCVDLDLKPGKVFAPLRFAVIGRTVAPGLWESLHVLGRERTLARLRVVRPSFVTAVR